MIWTDDLAVLGKIALSAILGGLIGLERELARKPAGLRTHILVAGASTLLVAVGNIIVTRYPSPEYLRVDPVRIIEAIVVGISFLGAGTIIQRERGERVEGLTTAASILYTAAISVAVALEQMILAIGSAFFILVVNRLLGKFEDWMHSKVDDDKRAAKTK